MVYELIIPISNNGAAADTISSQDELRLALPMLLVNHELYREFTYHRNLGRCFNALLFFKKHASCNNSIRYATASCNNTQKSVSIIAEQILTLERARQWDLPTSYCKGLSWLYSKTRCNPGTTWFSLREFPENIHLHTFLHGAEYNGIIEQSLTIGNIESVPDTASGWPAYANPHDYDLQTLRHIIEGVDPFWELLHHVPSLFFQVL